MRMDGFLLLLRWLRRFLLIVVVIFLSCRAIIFCGLCSVGLV
jgi:hypothetical protein